MAKAPTRIGDLQLAILEVLWNLPEAPVATVHEQLAGRGLALTTIATMLRKMEARGLVRHRADGRQFVYRAAVARHQVHGGMITDVVERLFGGSTTALVSRLLQDGDFDPGEIAELRSLLDAREREVRGKRPEGSDA